MIWYLIVCTGVYGGTQCLPAQVMPSREACEIVQKAYISTTRILIAHCRGVRKP